jgi:FKBP-type peptidyl-prolyl cis-trans isomerase SlyD
MKKLLALLAISGGVLVALFFLTQLSTPRASQTTPRFTFKPAAEIQDGAIVTLEYTLTDDTGAVIDSSAGKEPMTYIHGAGQIVPGLERALSGLKIGDQKKVQVRPEEGYGLPDQNAFRELPKDQIPPDAQKVGAMLMTKSPDGRMIPIRVHKVTGTTVVVDFNHPLAGKTLNFDVTIKEIKAAETK